MQADFSFRGVLDMPLVRFSLGPLLSSSELSLLSPSRRLRLYSSRAALAAPKTQRDWRIKRLSHWWLADTFA